MDDRSSVPSPTTSRLRAGVDANTASKVIFGLNAEDASELSKQAPELEAADFMYLPQYSVYCRLRQHGESTGWFSARTLPPDTAIRTPADLRARSETTYGRDAAEVERDVLAAIGMNRQQEPRDDHPDEPIGRRRSVGGRS